MVFAPNDSDLHLVEEFSQICSISLFRCFLDIEASNLELLSSVHLNHFILPTQFPLRSFSDFRISGPCLLCSKSSWVILNQVLITSLIALALANLYTLSSSAFVLDFLYAIGFHLIKGAFAR